VWPCNAEENESGRNPCILSENTLTCHFILEEEKETKLKGKSYYNPTKRLTN
jgi:hypothetical protein